MKTTPNRSLIKKNNFLVAFIEIIACQLAVLFKRMIKIILKFVTKLTELERICHNEKIESIRIRKIGLYILSSAHFNFI